MNVLMKFGFFFGILCVASCGKPVQKFEVHVVDESGTPMPHVNVTAWLNRSGKTAPLDSYKVSGPTNEKGVAELEGETVRYQTSVSAAPEGYYKSHISRLWITGRNGNRWEPWPVKVDLILKKRERPHAMYAFKVAGGTKVSKIQFPKAVAGSYGFDLVARDWVKPYGEGNVADFVLSPLVAGKQEGVKLPDGVVKIEFSNAADGIVAAEGSANGASVLSSPRVAPESGYERMFEFSIRPLEDGLFPGTEIGCRVWVFRVRSKVDAKGNVLSARYGKIVGHPEVLLFRHGPAFRICYYLNGKDNERNLEWDLDNNLFKDLTTGNWPKNP